MIKQQPKLSNLLRLSFQNPWVLGGIIFFLALIPRILNLNVFVGPDEFSWVTRSAAFAQALTPQGDLSQTYQTEHPAVTLMWIGTAEIWWRYLTAHIGITDWNTLLVSSKTIEVLAGKRMAVALVNSVLLAFAIGLTAQLFGSKPAWLAGIMLAFDPFFLTESRALRTEGVVAGFTTVALLSLALYAKFPQRRYNILAGILTGLALLSKISAIPLLFLGFLVVGLNPVLARFKFSCLSWKKSICAFSLWCGVVLATIVILWPALWVTPMDVIQRMFGYMFMRGIEGGGGSSESFFLGRALPENSDPGWLFYPVVLLYRTGPLLWLGLGVLLLLIVFKRNLLSSGFKLILMIMGLYLLAYLAIITRTELKYDRYIIPMLPVLTIMAALGLDIGWQSLVKCLPVLCKFSEFAVIIVLITQMVLALPHHPYYYTYWNPLLGGIKQAVKVLPVGVGSEGLDQVARYLNMLPNSEAIKVASASSQKIRPLFNGELIAMDNLDGKWVQADYVIIYISQLQRGRHSPDILTYLARYKPQYVLTMFGLDYAWLYSGPAAQYYGGGHKLEGRGTLFGYDLCRSSSLCKTSSDGETQVVAGNSLSVTLYWRNEGQQSDDNFFVRLMDVDNYVWAEAIAKPKSGFEEVSRQENAIIESEAILNLPIGMPPGNYYFKPGFRTSAGQIIGYFDLPDNTKPVKVTIPETSTFPNSSQLPVILMVNDDLAMLNYHLDSIVTQPGATIWLTLYWQATADVSRDYVIALQLLDHTDKEVAYWLGRPIRSVLPTDQWKQNQMVQDPWLLTIPPDVAAGPYRLQLSVYDAATTGLVVSTTLTTLEVTTD